MKKNFPFNPGSPAPVQQPSERLVYPNALRAAATIAVIVLHVSGGMMWAVTPDMWQFNWLAAADTLVHCAVPMFLMLSGMFLLSPEKTVTLASIFRKYILRLVIAYAGWSAVYALFTSIITETLATGGLYGLLELFFNGHYHLWFVPMMIGVYLTIPLFRAITEKRDNRLLHYTLAFLTLFHILYPNTTASFPLLHNLVDRITPSWFGINVAYFFAGYYFSRIPVSKRGKYIWLGLMLASGVWLVYATCSSSAALNALDESKWDATYLPMVIYIISVFMVFRSFGDHAAKHPWVFAFIKRLSAVSFTVYLCHDLFITILAWFGINALTMHPAISIPVLSAIVLALSMLLSQLLLSLKKLLFPRRSKAGQNQSFLNIQKEG